MSVPRKIWEHHDPKSTRMWHFLKHMESVTGTSFPTYNTLYDYSIRGLADFWRHTFNYLPIIYSGKVPAQVVDETARIDSIPKWFSGVQLNFSQNILFCAGANGAHSRSPGKEDGKIACTEVREGGDLEPIRHISWRELRARVGRLEQAMKAQGIARGDRIAIVSSNSLNTLTVVLATAALGAIFSTSSTDMGSTGILNRLLQIRPKLLFMDDQARYNGKTIDLRQKMAEIVQGMEAIEEFQGVVVQARWEHSPADVSSIAQCTTLKDFLSAATSDSLEFVQLEFSDPLVIVYSSGTTGQPKCIVHGVGGVILNGLKESALFRGIGAESCQLQYTTTGWIMYLGAVQALLTGCRMIMYDGSPFIPDDQVLLRLVEQEKATHLGISPRFLRSLQTNKVVPKLQHDLSSLQVMSSTGMVLPEALFEWVYEKFPSTIQLDNITGGADVAGCFGCSNPLLPIFVGGCQSRSLGIDVAVFDSTIMGGPGVQGAQVKDGVAGELVCRRPWPSMPVAFWGSDGAQKYHDSYFTKYDNCWTHGDFLMIHPRTKQLMLLGRADGVLNPSGIRFGSSEIYSIIENDFGDVIADSICVGQRRPQDNDESVMLFVLMKEGSSFTSPLVKAIKEAVRKNLTARHVPQFVFETPEIPMTVNMKKVELPVKHIVSGKIVKPSGTLLNPQSLEYYYQFSRDEKLIEQPMSKL